MATDDWIAIGTVGLATVAFLTIIKDTFREFLFHPKFEARFNAGLPDCHLVPVTFQEGASRVNTRSHYIRCRIANMGRTAARDVEVAVTEVRRRTAAGDFAVMDIATPVNLVWSHHNTVVLGQIPAHGAERHVTLGHLVEPEGARRVSSEYTMVKSDDAGAALFCLEFHVRSNTKEYLLQPAQEYQIDFEVAASNAKPQVFTFNLNHKGRWTQDEREMYTQSLGMSVVAKRRGR